jgi:peptide/nickel transport system permease protein
MSSVPIPNAAVVVLEAPTEEPRSWGAEVFRRTFSDWRAIAGAVWIVILALLAIFAPLLANTHPLLLKMDGKWSSPLLRHLTWADVTLVAMTALGVVLWFWRGLRASSKFLIFVAGLGLVTSTTLLLVKPPEAVVYEKYRDAARAGRITSAIYAPVPYSPTDRLRDISGSRLLPPSSEHWMGTDNNGADVASRIIHASRIAMSIGFISTGIAVVIGVVVGGILGFAVGTVDMIGMRIIEIIQMIPTLFLLIAFVAFYGRNLYIMMAIIGLTSWTGNARFIRAEFLKLRNQDFVHAAVAAGLPLRSVLFRHMLPNGVTPVLISATFGIASAILAEATLSFLGLGLVEEPSWGQLLEQARSATGTFVWWLAIFPGLAIFLTVFAYNLVGESLRDALDPKLRGS